MARVEDWEDRLNAVIENHQRLPGQWGKSDCWMLTMDSIKAVRGRGILVKLRGYKSEAEGYKVFARSGFRTVEEALASVLEPVPTLLAQRGDVGVIERDGVISSGVFTSAGFAVKSIYGHSEMVEGKRVEVMEGYDLQFFPIGIVKQAFQVR